jgi:hypothetical protein
VSVPFEWPRFDAPTVLGGGRTWTATFDSYDQRNDDAYYVVVSVSAALPPQ